MTDCELIITDANSLYNAANAAISSSKWKPEAQSFLIDILTNIFSIQDKLLERKLDVVKVYKFILCERGHIRLIASYNCENRTIRHSLSDNVLMPEIRKRIIYDNYASVKGRGISKARDRFEVHIRKYMEEHGSKGYILLGDFKKFYDNIDHEIAKEQFNQLTGYDEFVEWMLDLIFKEFEQDVSYMTDEEFEYAVNNPVSSLEIFLASKSKKLDRTKVLHKSVNIGDLIAQDVGIYYVNKLDTYLKYVLGVKYYGRYADDFRIIAETKEELNDILHNHIEPIVKDLKLFINWKKTHIISLNKPFTYLQVKYRIKNGKIYRSLPHKKYWNYIHKLRKLRSKMLDKRIEYEQIEMSFKSWMGDHYKLLSRKRRMKLIQTFEELYSARVHIVKRKMIITRV